MWHRCHVKTQIKSNPGCVSLSVPQISNLKDFISPSGSKDKKMMSLTLTRFTFPWCYNKNQWIVTAADIKHSNGQLLLYNGLVLNLNQLMPAWQNMGRIWSHKSSCICKSILNNEGMHRSLEQWDFYVEINNNKRKNKTSAGDISRCRLLWHPTDVCLKLHDSFYVNFF